MIITPTKIIQTDYLTDATNNARVDMHYKLINKHKELMAQERDFMKLPEPVQKVASAVFDTLDILKTKPTGIASYTAIALTLYPALGTFVEAKEAIAKNPQTAIQLGVYGSYRMLNTYGQGFLKFEAENKLGVGNIMIVTETVIESLTILYTAAADGIDLQDINAVLKLVPKIEEITAVWDDFILELQDLTPYEVALIGNSLGNTIYDLFV